MTETGKSEKPPRKHHIEDCLTVFKGKLFPLWSCKHACCISGGTVVQLENWRALRQTYFLASVLLNRNIDANLTSVLWISSCDHKQVISALHDWKRGETDKLAVRKNNTSQAYNPCQVTPFFIYTISVQIKQTRHAACWLVRLRDLLI